jgi:hypothetical protein
MAHNPHMSDADRELAMLEKIGALPYEPLSDANVVALREAFADEPKIGRETLYRPEYADQARRLCSVVAATDAQLAEFFGVCVRTITSWRSMFPAFYEACKIGKQVADDEMERSYYERGRGYNVVTKSVKFMRDGTPVEIVETQHVPGDVKAAFNWLKNRRQNDWKDRRELTGANGAPLHPAEKPRRSTVEIARRLAYQLQRGADDANGGPETLLPGAMKLIEEKVTITEE